MKKIVVFGILLLFCSSVWAFELETGADYYFTPNPQFNTHEDGYGAHVRLLGGLYGPIYWAAEYDLITDIGYQSGTDYLGSVRSNVLMGGVEFRPDIGWPIEPYVIAEGGVGFWSFHESNFLQGEGITIHMNTAFTSKVGAGVSWHITKDFDITAECSWFQSLVPVSCSDDGVSCNLPDDSPTGVEFIVGSVSGKYKF